MRVVVCDDHTLFVESLAQVLAAHGHNVIVTRRPQEAVDAVVAHQPDVCLLDVKFPGASGLDAARSVRQHCPTCVTLMLSSSCDPSDVAAARSLGVAAFLQKDQPLVGVLNILDRVAQGRAIITTDPVSRPRVQRAEVPGLRYLTKREREVLRRLVEAMDTSDIALSLGIAESTARTHVQNVLVKLGVHSRIQAVALVLDAELDLG